jgi:tetratricopeptide (TPR) repeat protein
VDDHADPFRELRRLLDLALVNDAWNQGWTAFTQKRFADALAAQERAATLAPKNAEVLYDLAVIRLAAGKRSPALEALRRALAENPKLAVQAKGDEDLSALRGDAEFGKLVR